MTVSMALTKIAKYEHDIGVRANFASPSMNPGNVALWVQTVNHERLTNTRPLELDDVWSIDAENRRDTVLADRAAQIAQNAEDEAGK